jgi:hypothetical protein
LRAAGGKYLSNSINDLEVTDADLLARGMLSVNIVLLFYNMGTTHQSVLAVATKSHQIALPISKLLFTISILRAVMDGNPIRNPGAPAVAPSPRSFGLSTTEMLPNLFISLFFIVNPAIDALHAYAFNVRLTVF